MKTISRALSTIVFLALVACNDTQAPTPAASETPKPVEAPKLAPAPSASVAPADSAAPAERPRRRERHGVSGVMFAALADLDIAADKKATLEKLDDELGGPAAPDAQKALHTAMVEGVKAGKVEMTKLEPALADADKAVSARKEAEAKALDALHKELDATRRKALVEAVKKREAEREARFANRGKPDKEEGDKAKNDERAKRRLERLSKQLELDADQQKKVEPILAKHETGPGFAKMGAAREEMKKRLDALLAAFEKDTFSAAKLDLGMDPKKHREMVKKRVDYLNALLGVLKPEQREKLAVTLEENPHARRGRGPHAGKPGGRRMMEPPPPVDEPDEPGDE